MTTEQASQRFRRLRQYNLAMALLHGALALRVIGDLTLNAPLRAWGGMLNVVAILLFLALMAVGVIRGRRAQRVVKTAPA